MSKIWSDDYVGIPHKDLGRDREGSDCYGLVRLVYMERLAICLPDYQGYGSADELSEAHAVISGAIESTIWAEVAEARPYDVVVFRRGRFESHVGIVVVDGLMLHVAAADCAKCERYDALPWKNRRPRFFRYRRK